MSVIIRLQNLPWNANALDIRRFFQGLNIPDGGVHIIGGEKGDAFIAFGTDEDARQAMMLNGDRILDAPVKLLLSSRTEMQNVISAARGAASVFIKASEGQFDRTSRPLGGANDDFRSSGIVENANLVASKDFGVAGGRPPQYGGDFNRDVGGMDRINRDVGGMDRINRDVGGMDRNRFANTQSGFGEINVEPRNFNLPPSNPGTFLPTNNMSLDQSHLSGRAVDTGNVQAFGGFNVRGPDPSFRDRTLDSALSSGRQEKLPEPFGVFGIQPAPIFGQRESGFTHPSQLVGPSFDSRDKWPGSGALSNEGRDVFGINRSIGPLDHGAGDRFAGGSYDGNIANVQQQANRFLQDTRDVRPIERVHNADRSLDRNDRTEWGGFDRVSGRNAIEDRRPMYQHGGELNRRNMDNFDPGRPDQSRPEGPFDTGRSFNVRSDIGGELDEANRFNRNGPNQSRNGQDQDFGSRMFQPNDLNETVDRRRDVERGVGSFEMQGTFSRDTTGRSNFNSDQNAFNQNQNKHTQEFNARPNRFGNFTDNLPFDGERFDRRGNSDMPTLPRDQGPFEGPGVGKFGERRPVNITTTGLVPSLLEGKFEFVEQQRRTNNVPELCVRISGLPFTFNYREVRRYFSTSDIPKDGLKLINDAFGKRSGVAYMRLKHEDSVRAALFYNGNVVHGCRLCIETCSFQEFDEAIDSQYPSQMHGKGPRIRSRSPINRSVASMPSEFCVVIKQLPPGSNVNDVRKFLGKIPIPAAGGPYMEIRNNHPTGNALIEFGQQKDYKDALLLHKRNMNGSIVSVISISKQEYENRVEVAKKISDAKLTPTNKSKIFKDKKEVAPRGSASAEFGKSESVKKKDYCVILRGIPWSTTEVSLRNFFKGIEIAKDGIHIGQDVSGRPSGVAYAQFVNATEHKKGLARNNEYIGKRYIEVKECTYDAMLKAMKSGGNDDQQKVRKANDQLDANIEDAGVNDDSVGFTIRLKNLNPSVQLEDIVAFFPGLHPITDSIKLQYKNGVPTGDGLVSFRSSWEADKAILKNNVMMLGRRISIDFWTPQ